MSSRPTPATAPPHRRTRRDRDAGVQRRQDARGHVPGDPAGLLRRGRGGRRPQPGRHDRPGAPAEPQGHPPSAQRRLRRQPEDLLHGGAARRRRHRGHAAPGRPVRPGDHPRDDPAHPRGPRRHGAGLAHGDPGRRRQAAACPPGSASPTASSRPARTWRWGGSSRSATPATARTAGASWRRCRSCATRTASCSTPRSSSRRCSSSLPVVEVPIQTRYFDGRLVRELPPGRRLRPGHALDRGCASCCIAGASGRATSSGASHVLPRACSARSTPTRRARRRSSTRTSTWSPSSTTGRCSRGTCWSCPASTTRRCPTCRRVCSRRSSAPRACSRRAVETASAADGTFVAINNKVSQSVPHLHVHVIPRRKKDGLRGFFWPRVATTRDDDDRMRETARRASARERRPPEGRVRERATRWSGTTHGGLAQARPGAAASAASCATSSSPGLIILIPIVLTVKGLWWLFSYVDGLAQPLAVAPDRPDHPGHRLRDHGRRRVPDRAALLEGPAQEGARRPRGPARRRPAGGDRLRNDQEGAVRLRQPAGARARSSASCSRSCPGRTTPGFLIGRRSTWRGATARPTGCCTVYIPTNHLYVGRRGGAARGRRDRDRPHGRGRRQPDPVGGCVGADGRER